MATIKRFEDLIVWQRCRELANFIYDITDDPRFKDWPLKRHIRKTAISPMSNVAEGFDRGTKAEFIDALFIAKGEVGEAKSQLYLAGDRGYVEISKFRYGLNLCDECSRLIQSFVFRLKSGGRQGIQFRKEKSRAEIERMKFDDKNFEILKKSDPEHYEKYFKDEHQRLKKILGS